MKWRTFLIIVLVLVGACNSKSGSKIKNIDPQVLELNKKAMQMARDNYRSDNAFELLNKAIEIEPNYYKSFTNKANIYVWRKEYEKALQFSEKSLSLNPNIAERWFTTGMLYKKTGEDKKAEKCFKKSIDLFAKEFENTNNERQKNALKFSMALSKVFVGDNSYKKDFQELEYHENYKSLVGNFKNLSDEELLDELL